LLAQYMASPAASNHIPYPTHGHPSKWSVQLMTATWTDLAKANPDNGQPANGKTLECPAQTMVSPTNGKSSPYLAHRQPTQRSAQLETRPS
jgi:hypothetical protein